jgi:hypothetical protein
MIFWLNMVYCPARGVGEKSSLLGGDFSLSVDVASRSQGFKERLGWSFHLTPGTLESLNPKPSVLAEGS